MDKLTSSLNLPQELVDYAKNVAFAEEGRWVENNFRYSRGNGIDTWDEDLHIVNMKSFNGDVAFYYIKSSIHATARDFYTYQRMTGCYPCYKCPNCKNINCCTVEKLQLMQKEHAPSATAYYEGINALNAVNRYGCNPPPFKY
jgi:hypothetical protein